MQQAAQVDGDLQRGLLLLNSNQLRSDDSAEASFSRLPSRRLRGSLPRARPLGAVPAKAPRYGGGADRLRFPSPRSSAPGCEGRAGPGRSLAARDYSSRRALAAARRPARRLSGSRAGAGARRPCAGVAGCVRGAPVASPARDGAAGATPEGWGLRLAARMELSSADAASTRFLGLTQRYRRRGGGGRARVGRGAMRCGPALSMAERPCGAFAGRGGWRGRRSGGAGGSRAEGGLALRQRSSGGPGAAAASLGGCCRWRGRSQASVFRVDFGAYLALGSCRQMPRGW